jgi:acyl-CoA synthetase (AMP-forming)/AMP-acid ligase II
MSCLSNRTVFTFIEAGGTSTTLRLAEQTGRVAAIAAVLAKKMPRDGIVGLLYRSEPNLVLAWLACISAGLKPLILQYPTRKQARTYWSDSVLNTVNSVGLAGIVADGLCAGMLVGVTGNVVSQAELEGLPDLPGGDTLPDAFTIVQLSSGTTGYRKAIEFTSAKLARHVEDYNAALGLTAADKIASWLPLYHDMGYVACFVMPMMLGIDVVMMDPITWVEQPSLLVDAIEEQGATLCYMPNFGFELMARTSLRPLPSIRRWISCSEPVSGATARKFLAALKAPETLFSPCYAMAENIFAVTLGQGCRTAMIDGTEIVSCGRAIPGVEIKTVDGEIWVRSPTALVSYLAGNDIRDADGFYPTGDLGQLVDGELFVAGRKQDLLIQAGRKFILSDIDLRLNELFADIRGRGTALALRDDRLGTEMPTVLIEAADFFTRIDGPQMAAALKDATGLDQIEVAFVPPRFLTKTSSGKVNRRKTAADWSAVQAARTERRANSRDPRAELAASFASVDKHRPVREALDSLAQTVLRIILDATPIAFDNKLTLSDIDAKLQAAAAKVPADAAAPEGLRIVSLANRLTMQNLKQPELERLEALLGCRVSFEHLCLPPSPVLMSDLVFHDFFRPRLDAQGFAAVDYAMEQIKNASVILVDDVAEMCFLYESTYPALSHNLERDPRADLMSFRWQQYTKSHHQLPLTVVSGLDIPLSTSAQTFQQMSDYLRTPIFRIALMRGMTEYTADWEMQAFGHDLKGLPSDGFLPALADWIKSLPTPPAMKPLRSGSQLIMSDLGHFCSHAVNKDAIDEVVSQFDRFCIAGGTASVPYVRQRLELQNKPYVQVPSHSQQILDEVRDSFDCLLLCGSVGNVAPNIPTVALQHADAPWRTQSLGDLATRLPPLNAMPVSGTDWFHNFELKRQQDYAIWSKARQIFAEDRVNQKA